MDNHINRREFLKLAALAPLLHYLPGDRAKLGHTLAAEKQPNILFIVFDSLSALNVSTHGYPRETMPNIDRFLSRATVFHNHYACAPFTTPSTASLFTGTYPWTHRTFSFGGVPIETFLERNIFQLFSGYYRVAYTHNHLADYLLKHFVAGLEAYKPRQDLYFENCVSTRIFGKDYDFFSTVRREILNGYDGVTYSLFAQDFHRLYWEFIEKKYAGLFPRGFMNVENKHQFILEDAIDWLISNMANFPKPFLGYFHFWPPHSPYNTRREFVNYFKDDGWKPPKKPYHPLQTGDSYPLGVYNRLIYDEFVLYVDAEFKRLYEYLEQNRLLENTWLIFTSDHGEMFERGFLGHTSPSLHQPVIRIPLMISAPGQDSRQEIHAATSTIDLLPTLLHVTGRQIPEWLEGEILPPYKGDGSDEEPRSIFALMASSNASKKPLSIATSMIVRDNFKLTRYFGYDNLEQDLIELYNLEEDPEELENLADGDKDMAQFLLNLLNAEMDSADTPFRV